MGSCRPIRASRLIHLSNARQLPSDMKTPQRGNLCQPRATPWENEPPPTGKPCKGDTTITSVDWMASAFLQGPRCMSRRSLCRAFSPHNVFGRRTQGVALGCPITPHLGLDEVTHWG
jgi:hypothetical protein